MPALLPEARSVRLRETDRELVLEVVVPPGTDLPQLVASLRDGVLTISVPRSVTSGSVRKFVERQ